MEVHQAAILYLSFPLFFLLHLSVLIVSESDRPVFSSQKGVVLNQSKYLLSKNPLFMSTSLLLIISKAAETLSNIPKSEVFVFLFLSLL